MSYCTSADINIVFGKSNVQKWADLDGDGNQVEIAARIARALVVTTVDLHNRLRRGKYELPIVANDDAEDYALEVIVDLQARLAGLWLHDNRGVAEVDDKGNRIDILSSHRKRVNDTIEAILSGPYHLDCKVKDDVDDLPEVL